VMLWLDALGLAAYAVLGAAKALNFGVVPFTAMIMGVLTATFGGIIRDVLAGEPNLLLQREIYVTAALLGAGLFVVLKAFGLPFWLAAAPAFCAALALRSAAIRFNLRLPSFSGKS
ncbi:MAG: TRIC cation channel family protein, partial [Asticcacaulis sp.]